MIKFKVDDLEYKVPDFISIENYVKIFKQKDIFSEDYFAAKIINKVTDCPVEDLLEGDAQEMNYVAAYILSLIPTENPKFIDRFELDGIHYGFFPKWRDMSYAEFVDMDTISTKKPEELMNMLHILAAIMYRPITTQRSQHDFDIEKYNIDSMKQRAELFKKKLDIKYILGAQFFFYQLRKDIFKLYPNVFDEEPVDMDEDKARMEAEEDDNEYSFQKTFGWFVVTNRIAGNDFTKHDYIYEKNLVEILNQLSYLIQHDREQERLQKLAQKRG